MENGKSDLIAIELRERRNKQCLHTNSATAKAISITDNSRAVMQLVNTLIKQGYVLKGEFNNESNRYKRYFDNENTLRLDNRTGKRT